MVEKIPPNVQTTYHQRAKDEEITKQEFIHRISVYANDHQQEIQLQYSVGDSSIYKNSLIFGKDVVEKLIQYAGSYFDNMDIDSNGTVSIKEFNNSEDHIIKKFLSEAYSLKKVPDNPEGEINDIRQKFLGKELSDDEALSLLKEQRSNFGI